MARTDDDDQMRNKVEDILAATALWSASIPTRSSGKVASRSASVGSDGRRWTKRCWPALKLLQRFTLKNPYMKAKVDRCRASDMVKFKCIRLSLRTDDNNWREYITTMVNFSFVERISGVLMLDTESFLAHWKQWYGC